MIGRRLDTKEFVQALVFAVALTEDYLVEMLTLALRADPRRLLNSIKGNEGKVSFELLEILDSDFSDLLRERAIARVRQALYAPPKDYLAYAEKVLGFKFPADAITEYFEAKATRDLYIHSDGRANDQYVEKAGEKARAERGEVVQVDAEYLANAIRCMKRLYAAIYKGMLESFGDDLKLREVLLSN